MCRPGKPDSSGQFVPFFDFVIAIVGLLDMTCIEKSVKTVVVGGARETWADKPVFIMTCVVARFTFFLNPVKAVHQHGLPSQPILWLNGGVMDAIPAHDMLGESCDGVDAGVGLFIGFGSRGIRGVQRWAIAA